MVCPIPLSSTHRYLGAHGGMAEEQVTRKLAAIFYAVVAGYSRLTGADEEGTHRLVSAYLDAITAAIERHNGTALHFAGDAVLAEFPTVSDALICAVNVQNHLGDRNKDLPDDRKVQFRIGVNLDEVIVDRDEIFGNGVNVAARLESLAEPGGICVSAAVRDAVGSKLPLDYEDMGEQSVKNIAEPLRAYAVQLALDAVMPPPSMPKSGKSVWSSGTRLAAIEHVPLPMLNTSFNEDRFCYWLAKLVALYVESQGVPDKQTTAWLDELRSLDEANEYLFGNFSVVTKASKQ